MKRTSLKVLLSAMIILTMIPFSYVHAATGDEITASNVSLTYAYDLRQEVINGTNYYTQRIEHITLNLPQESTGYLVIDTTSHEYGYNGYRWYNWDITYMQVFGAVAKKVSDTRWLFRFNNQKTVYIIIGNQSTLTVAPVVLYQEISSWYVSGTQVDPGGTGASIDITPITQRQDQTEVTLQQLLTQIQNLNLGNSESTSAEQGLDNITESTDQTVDQYNQLESTFNSNFNNSQTQITQELQNTSLTQFANAIQWFTAQLGFIYTAIDEIKILVQIPLILGIALFLIGRGAKVFSERKDG